MAEGDADFITIVSSEMIADVMQDYFNKYMYKKKVQIVDLKPTESGYMFSLAFAPPVILVEDTSLPQYNTKLSVVDAGYTIDSIDTGYSQGHNENGVLQSNKRDSKGKFVGKQKVI